MFQSIKEKFYNSFERSLEKFDPAWAKASLYFRSECTWHLGHGNSIRTRSLLDIKEELDLRKKGYLGGNYNDILHAIKICADENLPLPEWLAKAFAERFQATIKPKGIPSLDEAFSSPDQPTTENKRKIQLRDTQIGGELWLEVWLILHANKTMTSLDKAIDEALEKKPNAGVAKTKARELILERDATQKRLLPNYQELSRFLAIRRKALDKM